MFRSNRAGWFFILPAFVFLGLFKIVPIGVSVLESLRQTTYTGRSYFVGFENYTYLFFEDPTFWNSFWITLIYSLVVNPLIILIALVMALLLNENRFFTKFFRTVFFLPTAISFAVVSVIWSVVLDPHYGLANGFLTLFGLPAQPFFASTAQALWCLVFLNVWRSAGYWMMYFLAGLQNIPESLYQAADIDGASAWTKTRKITLPLLSRTFAFVLVANTAFNFLTFAPVYIITKGGPRGSTNLLMYESYKSAFVNLDMGRASAITTILLGIILIFSLFEFKWTKAGFEY
ncbi:MAG TPA: sugar ABC transporter permease [Thermotogota bacterium]|jgi:multiple sugar transport system permease protein|nr:MAG: sn-glycerol-3-phosphate transport system permease protein UgpA [Thermotogota bacterium ADurb.Bin062]HNW46009.1 sugar ABC transporter permease [Thermotogota bacterium]HPG98149.1 sugar ABC transporter permease [Thermotogota bacterium]HPY46850.1 sugar ABC transporter permease [Thermotogota bacterium]HQK81705.1 sugar ABC transporter permease [Thermotogota bacterium]